jgi:hypothetical protein
MASTRSAAAPGQVLRQTISLEPGTDAPGNQPESAPSFWERVYAIEPDDWSKYFIYLYRGRGANLEKIAHPIDADWVKQKYGGGDFRAILQDERHRIVCAHSFSIEGPPRLAPAEAQTSAPAAAAAVDSFQSSVLEIIREGQKETREFLRELMMSQRNPAPQSAAPAVDPNIALKGVIEIFTTMMPKQTDPLELLVKLQALNKPVEQMDVLTLVGKLKEAGIIPATPAAAGSGDLMGQLDSMLAVAEKLGARGGKEPGIVAILADKAPEIMGKIGNVVEGWAKIAEANKVTEQVRYARVTAAARPAGVEEVQPPQNVWPDPRSAAVAAHVPAGALDVEPIGTATTQPAGAAAPMDEIDAMKARLVRAVATEATGADIVSFMSIFDERLVDSFSGVNVEQLEAFFASDPILQQATKLPRFKEVMQEIVEVLEELPAPAVN